MKRQALGENEGMLFVFKTAERRQFWMYQTYIPLDIGYFTADGTLQEIYPMYPHDQNLVSSRRADIQYALEMNQGWFAAHKVGPGAKLDMELLRKALGAVNQK